MLLAIPDHTTYVEPFAGGAQVFFHKPRSKVEVLNDLDSEIVNFLRVCQRHPQELSRILRWQPASRRLFEWHQQQSPDVLTDIERAARFFYLQKNTWGGKRTRQNFHFAVIRLAFERHSTLVRWLPEKDLAGLSLGLVPDSYLEYEVGGLTYCAFVEYDRGTETLGRIERKVRAYLDLARSGRFERTFKRRFFRLCLVTDSAGRLATVSKATARITDRMMRLTTLPELSHHGPLMSIWRRPGASASESLTGS